MTAGIHGSLQSLGVWPRSSPVFTVCFMIMTLSSVGLPGTNGFIGEFLVLLGMFQNDMFFAIIATSGVILAACYMLWMFQRVMFLEITNPENEKLTDMTPRELCTMIPLIIFVFWIGFYPKPFTKTFDASIEHLMTQVTTERHSWLEGPSRVRRTEN